MIFLGLIGIAVLAGMVAAIAGFGIGSLVTPALALSVGTKTAVVLVAVPHAVATALRLWRLRSAVDRRVLIRFGLPSAAGGLLGALAATALSSPWLAVVLGGLLVFSGLSELTGLAARLRLEGPASTAAGVLSGVFGGLVGNQGGIRAAALLRSGLSRDAIVATATATAILVDAARLPIYLASSGAEIVRHGGTVAALTMAVVVGTLIGVPVLGRLPEAQFRRVLAVLLVLLGVGLVVGVGR